ncbi:putative acetylajmalan esterase-like [Capsicum annuum]|nr:putative acetylajmalan esterase-like [Capsicum annuum]KAF3633555.1 putative acetylajmalan esterase-like [Capsicum annuum]
MFVTALESGLPLLNPYKLPSANFKHGANFAVASATALSTEIMAEKKIFNPMTNNSLNVQLDWMSSHFETTCFPDCPKKLKKSLILLGEIGGNEFNYGLLQRKTIEELRKMVPDVVQTITHGVKRAIGFGATRIIVPGNFPIGCVPIFLTQFRTDNSTAYDEYHCLKNLNNFAIFYNHYLQQAIDELKKEYPNITLVYGDYYNAYMWLLKNAVRLDCMLINLKFRFQYFIICEKGQMALAIRVIVLSVISLVILQEKGNAEELLVKLKKPSLMNCRFDKIYQFGDSLSDTGNCIRESHCGARTACRRLPYGMNFYRKATGRCSDGMLMIDFIALESGLPLLNPYEDPRANFIHGANFAVAGATALSTEILAEKKIVNRVTNSSLNVQLDWMSSHFETNCFPDCPKKLKKSLFLVGEIGGNEFNYGLSQGRTIEELKRMVPDVIQIIIHGVKRVIGFGATRIIVPGNFPIGCIPIFLTQFMTDNSNAYDEYHCLKVLNNIAIFYNHHLQQAIDELKKEHPNITLIYGDYYNAYLWLLQNAVKLGFDKNSVQKACCGIGGEYNYDTHKQCGSPGVQACAYASTYISWDGIHLTQAAYKWLARWLIDDMLPQLNCHI